MLCRGKKPQNRLSILLVRLSHDEIIREVRQVRACMWAGRLADDSAYQARQRDSLRGSHLRKGRSSRV